MKPSMTVGEMLSHYLEDIIWTYPGPEKEGKKLIKIELPTPEEEGIEHLMPPPKKAKNDDENDNTSDDDAPFIDDLRDPDWTAKME